MREARIEMLICKAAVPLFPVGLCGGKAGAVVCGIPVVELVHRQTLPGAEQHTVGAGGQCRVSKPHQPPHPEALPRQNACHGPAFPVGILQALAQIEKAPALGHCGQAALHSPAHRDQHGAVRAQLPGIQLRVAAGQVEPADLLRQGGVLQGAEPAEFRPRPLQRFQRFGVGEAKRRIPCNGNGNAGALFLCSLGRQLSRRGEPIGVHQRRCAFGQDRQLFPIHHQRIGHPADLLL